MGTRIVIDENGQYAIISYGQAQPRHTGTARKDAALQAANEIAANRARSRILHFIEESMVVKNSQWGRELSREFSDETIGTETIRNFQKAVRSKHVKVRMHGIRIVKEWSFEHPVTGQVVAGTVIAWSPASEMLSKKAAEMMRNQPKSMEQNKKSGLVEMSHDTPALQSMPVDTSSY